MSGDVWNETLFDGFPEPVLLLREGRVAYRNRAAAERFPGLRIYTAPIAQPFEVL